MPPTFLITSATGRQGGAAVRILLNRGAKIHALVRNIQSSAAQDLKKLGVVLFEGDFDNVSAVQAATRGVSGIFLNLWPTPEPEDQLREAHNFVDAAKEAGVTSIVVSTAFLTGRPELWSDMGEIRAYYQGKAAVEDVVRRAGFSSYTILRPSFLMHNYFLPDSQYHFPELASKGVLAHAFEAGRRMPHLDAADVGKYAAEALLRPEDFNGHEIELGHQNLTPEDACSTICQVSGRQVTLHKRTPEEIKDKAKQPPVLPFQLLANEEDITIDGDVLQKTYGIACSTFASFLERERNNLLASLPKRTE